MAISKEEFLLRQPSFPDPQPTDSFYFELANRLLNAWDDSPVMKEIHPSLRKRVVLGVIGYYQDVIVDAGPWRSFINENRRRYGRTLPFFPDEEGYIDYELNRVDLRWLIWYSISMQDETNRLLYPLHEEIDKLSGIFHKILEEAYEEAPMPEGFDLAHEVEMHNPEDAEAVMALGNWLFLHSYLLTPAHALTLSEMIDSLSEEERNNPELIQKRISQSMAEDPTGPLALYLREWLFLILNHRMPKNKEADKKRDPHPYYEKFTKAADGEPVKFFSTYGEMNRFLIEVLGWKDGEEHLAQLKNSSNFILYVDKYRGMLVARNVAQCFRHPANPMYDEAIAKEYAIKLLTVRGACPADLVMHACKAGWLPDAAFPGTDDTAVVAANYDFIGRCYLQLYYRD